MQHILKDVFFFAKNNAPDNQVVRRNLKIVFGILNKKPYISFVRLREMKNLNTKNMKTTKNPLFPFDQDAVRSIAITIFFSEKSDYIESKINFQLELTGVYTPSKFDELYNLKEQYQGENEVESFVKYFQSILL